MNEKMDIYIAKLDLVGYLSTLLAKKKYEDFRFRPGIFILEVKKNLKVIGVPLNEITFVAKRSVDSYERKLLTLRSVTNPSIEYDVSIEEAERLMYESAKAFVALYSSIESCNQSAATMEQ